MKFQANVPFRLTKMFYAKLGEQPVNKRVLVIRDLFTAMHAAIDNSVTFITDDKEAHELFSKNVANNDEFGNNDTAIFVDAEINKNAWKDFIKEVASMPKFDVAIMNPPYDKNLHLKILEAVIPVADKVVNISPIRWLKVKELSKYNKKIADKIESLDILNIDEASQLFGIRQETELGISVIGNGGYDYQQLSILSDPIVKKCIEKSNLFLKDKLEYNVSDGFRVRLIDLKPLNAGTCGKKGTAGWFNRFILLHRNCSWVYENGYQNNKHWSFYNGTSGCKQYTEKDNLPYSIHFTYMKCAVNFENSTKTKVYSYIYSKLKVNSHTNFSLLPFMHSYQYPWTDKRFCAHFNITGYIDDEHATPNSEWEIILNTMKEYV
jgi:hypothetical protein